MRAPSIGWLVVWGLFLILSRKVRPSGVLTEFARTGKRARRLAYFWWQMFQSFSAVSFVEAQGSPVASQVRAIFAKRFPTDSQEFCGEALGFYYENKCGHLFAAGCASTALQ